MWVALALAGGLFASALALVVWRRRRRRLGPEVPDPIVAMKAAPATTPPKVPVG
jgi:LPXTG-motif cell wall-anchored protein